MLCASEHRPCWNCLRAAAKGSAFEGMVAIFRAVLASTAGGPMEIWRSALPGCPRVMPTSRDLTTADLQTIACGMLLIAHYWVSLVREHRRVGFALG
jgi:hypothetical protein